MKRIPHVMAAVALATASSATAHAALVFEDNFMTTGTGAYNVGTTTPITGQNPGSTTGAGGAWSMHGDTSAASVSFRATNTGLSLPGVLSDGGAIESYRDGTGGGGQFLAQRPIAGSTQITSSEDVYFSALVSFTSGSEVGVGLRFANTGREHFGVGFDSAGRAGVWHDTNNNSSSGAPGGDPVFLNTTVDTFIAGTTYLIVGKMDPTSGLGSSSNAETITLVGVYASGDALVEGSVLTASEDVYFSEDDVSGNFSGQTLAAASFIAPKSAGGVVTTMDELRIGRSFAEVVPVPEPASLALLGVGALLLAGRARRA